MKRAILFLGIILCAAGCSTPKPQGPVIYSQQMGSQAQKTEDVVISKKRFTQALTLGASLNDVRLVEVFRREQSKLPQYRLFDIRKGSPYELMRLEDGDVLLAADDRIIFDPQLFRVFVTQVMKDQKSATVTISRAGVTILYRYEFSE